MDEREYLRSYLATLGSVPTNANNQDVVPMGSVGVRQARRMTRMRKAAIAEPGAADPAALQRGTRMASALRASIGVCSFAVFVLAVAMI